MPSRQKSEICLNHYYLGGEIFVSTFWGRKFDDNNNAATSFTRGKRTKLIYKKKKKKKKQKQKKKQNKNKKQTTKVKLMCVFVEGDDLN